MLVAVVVLACGETALSRGMKSIGGPSTSGLITLAAAGLRSPWLWAGVSLLVIHLGLYLAVLSEADLSFALPLTAASYPISALLARFVLHEDVGFTRWGGTLLITLGVAIVAFGEGGLSSKP
jgi:drug/metabolite transporter (DMT)-like permease